MAGGKNTVWSSAFRLSGVAPTLKRELQPRERGHYCMPGAAGIGCWMFDVGCWMFSSAPCQEHPTSNIQHRTSNSGHAGGQECPRSLGRSSTSGFTLIELMVVIVLIAVMTAMIIPEMKGTFEDAL